MDAVVVLVSTITKIAKRSTTCETSKKIRKKLKIVTRNGVTATIKMIVVLGC